MSLPIGKTGGIYRTTDEGDNWDKIADRNDLGNKWTKIYKLLIVPGNPDALFAATSSGIYKSENFNHPNENPDWDRVMEGRVYDIELKPGSNSTLYATAFIDDDNVWEIMISNNGGGLNTWDPLSPRPQLVESNALSANSFTIEVSKAKPDYLYCLVNEDFYANLYYYDFENTGNWNLVSTDDFKMDFGQGHAFGVDQATNGEEVITSFLTDKKTFNIYAPSEGTHNGQNHVDVEDILFHPYNQDEIWLCTHGGVEKSTNGDPYQPKYDGLSVANVEEMATSITNPELIMIGLYHDGTHLTSSPYVSEDWQPNWNKVYVGDGMRPLIDPIDPNKMWASYQEGRWKYTDNLFTSTHTDSRRLTSHWGTEGVLNKVTPSIMYRHALYSSSNNLSEVYLTETTGLDDYTDDVISSFYPDFSNPHKIIGLFTPYTNGDHLLVTVKDDVTSEFFLYRTTNVNSLLNILWTKLEIPRNNGGIATVNFDPYDENIIYLVYSNPTSTGDYASEMVYRIDYTDETDPQTTNLTNNLPNTTTLKDCIAIDNGIDRGIYLYTSYGIFYTNNDLINSGSECWQKFGKELPHTRGGSLEINYVCKKLRAGLFGRGVWEIDLPCIIDVVDVNLQSSETWTEDIRIAGTLTINPQVELTIQNSTTSFGENGKIIVKPGAKLIIDNAKITKACSEPWAGIEIWGNSTAHQYADANGNYQQGYIELKNGAIIENAWEAIQPWNPQHWDQTGGIISANGATFKNNRRAMQFIAYQNYDPQTSEPSPNQSVFRNCTFETTPEFDDMFGESTFYSFVSMFKVDGIKFYGCDFADTRVDFHYPIFQAVGIWALDANFYVLPRCNIPEYKCWMCPEQDLDPSTFTGLSFGVLSSQSETMNTYVIDRVEFINNQRPLHNISTDFGSCIRSSFELGTKQPTGLPIGQYYYPNGIANAWGTGFTFEQNLFKLHQDIIPDVLDLTTGIVTLSVGEDVNEVFNNSFIGLGYGNKALGDNHNISNPEIGLNYRCNENQSIRKYDFLVYDGDGIATCQGNKQDAAGNTFSLNSFPDGSDFTNETNLNIKYYYLAGFPDEKPLNTVGVRIEEVGTGSCQDRFTYNSDIRLSIAEKDNYKQQYYDNKAEYNNTKALYESLKDGGNTSGTVLDIETSWPDETWALRAQLLADSPHLSEEVLRAAADQTDVLPHTIMFEICIENPEEMRNEGFLEYLAIKEDPMPDYMIDDLREGADEDTYKSVLQSEMAKYAYLWGTACNNIIRDIVLDSTGIMYDSLLFWINNKESIISEYQIVDCYLAQEDYTNAIQKLNTIPNDYELSGKHLDEYNYFHELKTLQVGIYQQGRNILQLDSLEVLDLVNIADSSNGIAAGQAQGILNFAYGYNYYPFPNLYDSTMKSSLIPNPEYINQQIPEKRHFINALPNPASQWVAFDYTLPWPAQKGTIIISDISGREIHSRQINQTNGQIIWDTRGLAPGVYLYSIQVSGKLIDKRKLIISN